MIQLKHGAHKLVLYSDITFGHIQPDITIYSPSCFSKPVQYDFLCGTHVNV